jgi:hypothetical protein
MAFGLKYELFCKTKISHLLYTVNISFDGYTGDPVDRNVPLSPFHLRKATAGIIRGSSFDFAMREAVDFEFREFYTNSNKKIKVELFDPAENLIWVGYNLPQQYQSPYVAPPNTITFTAADGLGLLKNEDFTLTGLASQLDIIRHCIDKTGLSLSYSIAVNTFETTHDHDRSPLAQTYLNCDIFSGLKCYDVLERVLGVTIEITQCNGMWYITHIADKKSTRMIYTSAGVYSTTEAAPAVLDLGMPDTAGTDVHPVGRLTQTLEPGGKSVEISHDYGRKKSFLSNYDFAIYASSMFTDWTKSGTFSVTQRTLEGKKMAYLTGYSNVDTDHIQQSVAVENVATDDFVFEIDFVPVGQYNGAAIFMKVRMLVYLFDGSTFYYLTETGWTTTLTLIEKTISSTLFGTALTKLQIITSGLPASGDLYVRLFRYKSTGPRGGESFGGVLFSEALTYFVNNGQLYPGSIKTKASFSNSTEPNDLPNITLAAGDAPDLANNGALYRFITRLSDGTPTSIWHRLGSASEYILLQQIALALASDNRIAKEKLSGLIRGSNIKFNSIIKHAYNTNREYEIAEGEWDIYSETFSVTLLELLAWSDETVVFTSVESETTTTGSSSSSGTSTGGGSINISALDILAKLLGVDGTGSLLDADLLDGEDGSYYAPIDSPIFTNQISTPAIFSATGKIGFFTTAPDDDVHLRVDKNGATFLKISNEIGTGNTSAYAGLILFSSTSAGTLNIYPSDYNVAAFQDRLGLTANSSCSNGLYIRTTANSPIDFYTYAAYLSPTMRLSGAGNLMLGFESGLSKLSINGGLHVGGESDAGDNNLIVDGTALFSGVATFSADLGTSAFTSGFTGSGWKMDEVSGKYNLTIDNLIIRESLTAYELDINKISSINGGMVISVANATSLSVSGTTIYFDEDNGSKLIPFAVNDYIRAQVWTGRGVASYLGKVTAVNHSNTYGDANVVATTISGTPWDKMDLVQVGSSSDAARQNLIYLTASDTNNPYIDVVAGVTAGSFAGKTKVRLGNLTGITDATFGALSGYGLFADNAYLTGALYLPTGGMTNEGSSASSVRIYAGDTYANRAAAPFRVTQDGSLTALGVAEIGTNTSSVEGKNSNIAIKGGDIWENAYDGDASYLRFNYKGFSGGSDHYRNAIFYNGRGADATYTRKLLQISGELGGVIVGSDIAEPIYFDVNGPTTLYGTLHVDGAAEFDSSIQLDGAATFNSSAEFNSTIQLDGAATFNSTAEFNSTVQLDGTVTCNAGFIVGRYTQTQFNNNVMSASAGMIAYNTSTWHFYGYTNAWYQLD